MNCDFCDENTDEEGTARCVSCYERKCISNCIPGGVGTECLQCEEEMDDEKDED